MNAIVMAKNNAMATVRLRYDANSGQMLEQQQKSGPFLKGPITISWLNRVARLPGKAINVALAIRWLSDMNADYPIKLTRKAMEQFNFSSDAASDALRLMEKEGLIKVQKRPGQKPLIEISTSWRSA